MAGIYKTKGIVLKSLKYSESSVIVDVYTQEKGLRTFIVSGLGSKSGNSKASCFQHLNIIDLVAYDKSTGMARIKEQRVDYFYKTLPYNVAKSSIGLFALEIFRNAVKESEANAELFQYLNDFLIDLDDKGKGLGIVPIKFMLDLAKLIGIIPINNRTDKCCYLDMLEGEFVSTFSETSLDQTNSLVLSEILAQPQRVSLLSRETKKLILDWLIKYYQVHLTQFKELKSVEVLRDVF